jgi:glycosyltransferase involved in cell wall biosynthesis
MRIAQVAPLAEAVPPKLYGGTERVVSWLTEELVRQGHQVTLFASGDSKTSATLVPSIFQGLRLAGIRDHTASTLVMLDQVIAVQMNSTLSIFMSTFYNFPYFRTFSKNA